MRAYLLSIGDELASGLTTNTNSAWLAEHLTALGIKIAAHLTVGDDLTPIVSAIRNAFDILQQDDEDASSPGPRGGILLISGGLGPTEDDVTRQALAAALDEQLVEDPDAVLQLENWFKSRNRLMSPSNRVQALRPSSSACIENTAGTAPGLRAKKHDVDIFVVPGVPREMKEMFTRSILPLLKERAGENVTLVTKLNTFGVGESVLGERLKDLMTRGGNPCVGTTVQDGIVSVRIYSSGPRGRAQQTAEQMRESIDQRLGPLIFGQGDETIEFATAALLLQRRHTLSTAESCTGGLLSKLLTDIAGASAYFLRGWITYSNQAKHDELSVPLELIERFGAVSEQTARAMAEGARTFAQSDYALSITGIAGPTGATEDKPVGTTWIALAGPNPGNAATQRPLEATIARRFIFPGSRETVRLRAAQMAIALLRWKLLGIDPPI